jgi:hypothetical protein
MDNDYDISIIRAEERGLISNDHAEQLDEAERFNLKLADLLKLDAHKRKFFAPVEYTITDTFELCPPIHGYYEHETLLGAVEEAVDELLPWVTALVELRHQLRKGK